MKKLLITLLALGLVAGLVVPMAMPVAASGPVTKNYGDVSLSGEFESGNFPEVWDLTACDLVIRFTYDANGMVDDFGGDAAHAWAQFGARQLGGGNFNPTWDVEGAGVWLATDYDWAVNTFDPDPAGAPNLDLDDKVILQKAGGHGEGDYNLPSVPPAPGNNHRVWWDRDGVDPYQNPETANTGGIYPIIMTLHATSATSGTAYMNIRGLDQGFETDGNWNTIELTPAGMTFTGDMTRMQVFYGLYGYGATHSAAFQNITVTGCQVVTVTVLNSQGSPLPGVRVLFSTSSGFGNYSSANTDASGVATKYLPPGTYWFKAIYQNTSAVQTQDISNNHNLTFYTSKSQVQVNKSDGSAFAGVRVLFSPSNAFGNYISVNTDASGLAKTELFPGTIWYKAITNNTSAVQSAVLAGDGKTAGQSGLVTFYTSKSVAKVQNCDGVAFAGIAIKFYGGGYQGTWASATTDASGLASIEEFPNTWKIQASVNRTSEVKDQLLAGDGKTAGQSTTTIFTPTKVIINGASTVQQWIGYWDSPLPSPFYMFPATVKLRINKVTEVTLTISSGCVMEKSLVNIKLISSTGAGLAGGTVYYFNGGSSYPSLPGATDANGNLSALIDGSGNREWHMTYAFLRQTKNGNASPGPVVFQTKLVTVELRDSNGDLEDPGTGVRYWGAGANRTFGSGSTSGGKVTMELLPPNGNSIEFGMTYAFATKAFSQDVVANATVTFRSANVVSASNTCTSYWAAGAERPFTSGMEMFPASYQFRFSVAPLVNTFTITAGSNTIQ